MGVEFSAEKFYADVVNTNLRIRNGPPLFIKLNESQKVLANELMTKLNDTCDECEILQTYADKINSEKLKFETLMPNENTLSFDKKYLLNNVAKQLSETCSNMFNYGFMSNMGTAYIGRLLIATKWLINSDLKDEDILSCKESVEDSLTALKNLCATLPPDATENLNVVWVINEKFIDKVWGRYALSEANVDEVVNH